VKDVRDVEPEGSDVFNDVTGESGLKSSSSKLSRSLSAGDIGVEGPDVIVFSPEVNRLVGAGEGIAEGLI
jgi:hypothetical protein